MIISFYTRFVTGSQDGLIVPVHIQLQRRIALLAENFNYKTPLLPVLLLEVKAVLGIFLIFFFSYLLLYIVLDICLLNS